MESTYAGVVCLACGRTSDHTKEPRCARELEQYECNVPWVEMPSASMTIPAADKVRGEEFFSLDCLLVI